MDSFTKNKFIMMDIKNENGALFLFQQFKKVFTVLFNNKFKIIFFTIFIVGLGVFMSPKKKYLAETTLFFNAGKESKFLSLVNRFGGGGFQDISFDKFKIVAFSNNLIESILLSDVIINNEKGKLINFIIKSEKLDKSWENKPELYDLDFDQSGFVQDSIQKQIVKLVKNKINLEEDKNGLIRLTFLSFNEDLALLFNNYHFDAIDNFFKDIQLKDDMNSLKILSYKRDSILRELTITEDFLANTIDFSQNTVKQKGRVEITRKERELRILNGMYVELVKQYELINYRIQDNKNLIIKLDSSKLPLEKIKRSLVKTIVIFGLVGFILSCCLVYFIYFFKELNKLSKADN